MLILRVHFFEHGSQIKVKGTVIPAIITSSISHYWLKVLKEIIVKDI